MRSYLVKNSSFSGEISLPPSKSHTLRALTFALFSNGVSIIHNALNSPDVDAMIEAIKIFGAKVDKVGSLLKVQGRGLYLAPPSDVIDCRNSGIVYRFMTAISSLQPFYTVITGDDSIKKRRPIQSLLNALNQLGAFAVSSCNNGQAPLIIKGVISPGKVEMNGEDSQLVSALLIAGAFAQGPLEIHVENPKELPWIDLTLSWLDKHNIPYERKGYTFFKTFGKKVLSAFEFHVPGDLSSLAFPVAAALITHSTIKISNVDLSDSQGDKVLFTLLEKMGAQFKIEKRNKTLDVLKTKTLNGIEIDCDDCIDAVPILAVIGCFCEDALTLKNCAIARQKESDRLSAISQELRKMGAFIEEKSDELRIYPSKLSGFKVKSHFDHRIAMALCVAGFASSGMTIIEDVDCINKTFSSFERDFKKLGGSICQS